MYPYTKCVGIEGEYFMVIQDFTDMVKFEQIISNWAKATGLATVAVGADGKYISKCYNFTDFCINLTRGCSEGKRRCEKYDREGTGVYYCHAGLINFGIDLEVNGQKMGSVIGGQVLPKASNKEQFREAARAGEMGKGFNVVAKQVGDLSTESRYLNEEIANNVTRISEIVHSMAVNNE